MKRYFGIILLALILAGTLGTHKAFAHYPASNGSVSAELHIEPDDVPTAGQASTIYFIFNDSASHFKLIDCDCNLSIANSQGRTVYSAPLQLPPPGQLTVYGTAGVPFSFESGNYQVQISAQPLNAASFKPFLLNWSLPIAPAPQKSAIDWHSTIGLFLGIALLFIAIGCVAFFFS